MPDRTRTTRRLALAVMLTVLWGAAQSAAARQEPSFDQVVALGTEVVAPAARALAAGDVAAARRLVPEAQRRFRALPPVLQTAQATTLQRLARDFIDRGALDDGIVLLQMSASALERAAPGANPSLVLVLADLARAHRLAGRLDQAESLLARARSLRDPSAADFDLYILEAERAELRLARGEVAEAERLLQPLVDAADRMPSWQYVPSLIELFDAWASVQLQRGDVEAARRYSARAQTIRTEMAKAAEQLRRFAQP